MVKSVVCYESSCISDDTFRLIMEGWEGVRRRLGLGEEEGMYNVFSKYSRNYSLIYNVCLKMGSEYFGSAFCETIHYISIPLYANS